MRFKIIEAKTMPEALAQLRAALGPEALILDSQRTASGVAVTGGIEPMALPEQSWPHRHSLTYHGVPSVLAARLEQYHASFPHWSKPRQPAAARLSKQTMRRRRAQPQPDLAETSLAHALAKTFQFGMLSFKKPLVLIGTPGAGKTLSLVKLAVQLVRQGTPPLVINSDHYRAAALAQLSAFTRLLGLELIDAPNPAVLRRALAARRPNMPVLIDLPGVNPFAKADVKSLQAMTETAEGSAALVLQAGLDPVESAELAVKFAELGAVSMIPTRLDMARRLGGILAAAAAVPLTLTNAGVGPGAADGMAPLTPHLLAQYLTRSHAAPEASERNAI